MQWRPPGAAKTRACARSGGQGGEPRWHGAGAGMAASTAAALAGTTALGDVGLARRGSGRRRRRRQCSGTLSSRGGGEQGNGRRRHQKKQVFGGRAKEGGRKYMGGGAFCPG